MFVVDQQFLRGRGFMRYSKLADRQFLSAHVILIAYVRKAVVDVLS